MSLPALNKDIIESIAEQYYYKQLWMRWDKLDFSSDPMSLDHIREMVARSCGYAPNEYTPPRQKKRAPSTRLGRIG